MDDNNNVRDEPIIIKKWRCDQCTYENWPSAAKCTLCRNINRKQQYKLSKSTSPSPNPITTTTNQIQLQPTDQDIYKLANIMISEDEQLQHEDSDPNKKWNCLVCTYLNWPKSKKCVQCYTQRCSRRSSPKQNSPRSCPQSPCTVPKQVNAGQPKMIDQQSDENASMTIILKKWTCSVCTYENWPKSTKCVMCKLHRQPQQSQQTHTASTPGKRVLIAKSQSPTMSSTIPAGTGNDLDRLFLLACQGNFDRWFVFLYCFFTNFYRNQNHIEYATQTRFYSYESYPLIVWNRNGLR